MQKIQPIFFKLGMLLIIIGLYHFTVALTLAESHKMWGKQNMLGSFSCTSLSWSEQNLI